MGEGVSVRTPDRTDNEFTLRAERRAPSGWAAWPGCFLLLLPCCLLASSCWLWLWLFFLLGLVSPTPTVVATNCLLLLVGTRAAGGGRLGANDNEPSQRRRAGEERSSMGAAALRQADGAAHLCGNSRLHTHPAAGHAPTFSKRTIPFPFERAGRWATRGCRHRGSSSPGVVARVRTAVRPKNPPFPAQPAGTADATPWDCASRQFSTAQRAVSQEQRAGQPPGLERATDSHRRMEGPGGQESMRRGVSRSLPSSTC